jgi:hypothetical protein
MNEKIEENIVRDIPARAMVELKRKINGYRRLWERFYVGVTSDPEGRWDRHSRNGWCKMVVLYEAFSPKIAREMEMELIDYAFNCGFRIPPENVGMGGEGILDGRRYHYIYVLVGERRSGAFSG